MIKHLLLTVAATIAFTFSYSQSGRVGIGTSNPEQKLDVAGSAKANDKVIGTRGFVAGAVTADTAKAIFSTDITNKGFYIPRLTTAQKTTLGGTLNGTNKGLLVFDTDLNRTDFWDGSAWKAVGDGAGGPPTGAAGGDLTGTYPNPTIANDKVTSNKILDGTITSADLATPAVNAANQIFNTLPVGNGGTGVNTVTGAMIGNGSSPVSGVASSSGNQVLRRNNANTAYEFAQVQYSDVAGTPSTLPPSGAAGGDLTGTYPNPTVGAGKIDNGKLANDAVSTTKIANNAVTIAKLPSGASGTTFLRGDGTWQTPTDNNTTYSAGTGLNLSGYTFNLSNTGTAGTYTKVTTNAQGQVTGGTTLVASDIPDLSGSYIKNQNSLAQSGNFWIDGDGRFNVDKGPYWAANTDAGFVRFHSTGDAIGQSWLEIGTQDNGDEAITFTQSGNERMRIHTGGNVGINNNLATNTGAALSITPLGGSWNEGIEINPSSGNFNAIFFRQTANSIANTWFLGKINNNNFGLLRNSLTGMVGTTRSDQPFEVTTTGNSIFGGNVGIGVSPSHKLTIAGTGGVFGVDNSAVFYAKNSGGAYDAYFWPRWSDDKMYMNYGSGGFTIRNNSSAITMFMDNNNRVAINNGATADANSNLYVNRPSGDYGAGKAGIYSYRTGTSGAANGGTGWSSTGVDAAIKGYVYWGNNYTAGVYGYNYGDYSYSAGVMGQMSGSTYGALAYNDANSTKWAGYFTNSGPNVVQILSGTSAYTDWPTGWGGGLSTWDMCVASIRLSGTSSRSDVRLKKDIQNMDNSLDALQTIGKLNPVTYHWKDERLPKNLRYGFIAQEIQKVLPELISVGTDSMQTLGVNYMDIIPILTRAVQEQQILIDELRKQNIQQNSEFQELKKLILERK